MVDWILTVIGGLTFLAALFVIPQIQEWIRGVKLKKFNRKISTPISKARDRYFKNKYGIVFEKESAIVVQATQLGKPDLREHESFTAIRLPLEDYQNTKDLDLDTLSLLISLGVRKPFRDKLIKKGLDFESAEEISGQEIMEFIDVEINLNVLKKKDNIEENVERLKNKTIENETNLSPKRELIRKNGAEIKQLIRKNYARKDLKEKYNEFLSKNKEFVELYKDDVGEILKIRQRQRKIREDPSFDMLSGKEIKFTKSTKDKLIELKALFLRSRAKFVNRVKKISCRSEQIYALILTYPGVYYETQMSDVWDIPQPTISLYAEQMSKDGFLIKDTYSAKGNYVYLYPLFTSSDIKNNLKSLIKTEEIALIGKIIEKNGLFYVNDFEGPKLVHASISQYAGNKVILKGKLTEEGSINVDFITITEPQGIQTPLTQYG